MPPRGSTFYLFPESIILHIVGKLNHGWVNRAPNFVSIFLIEILMFVGRLVVLMTTNYQHERYRTNGHSALHRGGYVSREPNPYLSKAIQSSKNNTENSDRLSRWARLSSSPAPSFNPISSAEFLGHWFGLSNFKEIYVYSLIFAI